MAARYRSCDETVKPPFVVTAFMRLIQRHVLKIDGKAGDREGEAPAEPTLAYSSVRQERHPPKFKTWTKQLRRGVLGIAPALMVSQRLFPQIRD